MAKDEKDKDSKNDIKEKKEKKEGDKEEKKEKKEGDKEEKKEKKEGDKETKTKKQKEKKEKKLPPKEIKKEIIGEKEGEKKDIRHIIRIADTDLDGKRDVQFGLTGIKGIGRRIARTIADNAGIDPSATLGYLVEDDIEKLKRSVDNIIQIVPSWMTNKQNDIMTGEDRHLIGSDVMLGIGDDINTAKKMRSYKGIRHERGLKVRGQKTRSSGRKGRTVGVSRIALTKAKEGEKKEEKEVKKEAKK